jgi:D-alanine-D-alanine ligase
MDKNMSKLLCSKYDIPTPNWIMLENERNSFKNMSSAKAQLDGSVFENGLVVKPNSEGSSIGISILEKWCKKSFEKALSKVLDISDSIMIESFIDGRELTVSILNGETLPIVEIVPKGDYYDYKSKYTKFQSDYIAPANINEKTQELLSLYSLKIHKLIGCGAYSRVDFRLSNDGKVYFLEINTLPGFTDTSLFPKAAEKYGLDYRALIKKIINLS